MLHGEAQWRRLFVSTAAQDSNILTVKHAGGEFLPWLIPGCYSPRGRERERKRRGTKLQGKRNWPIRSREAYTIGAELEEHSGTARMYFVSSL